MNDLVRPAMYDAYHEIVPVHRDTLAPRARGRHRRPDLRERRLLREGPPVQEVGEGELVAFMSAGAYGYTMASRYNTRGMPAEVLVNGCAFELVNARETFEPMIAGETSAGLPAVSRVAHD